MCRYFAVIFNKMAVQATAQVDADKDAVVSSNLSESLFFSIVSSRAVSLAFSYINNIT